MKLTSVRFAILAEKDFQDMEVMYPYYRLKEEGAEVHVLGAAGVPQYKGKYGYPVNVTHDVAAVKAPDYHGVLVPGGWAPDFLRRSRAVLDFVRAIHAGNKPVAFICHAGWVLISAGVLKGRKATSFSAIRDDMENAGCIWSDEPCVTDGNLISARTPDDLPVFTRTLIEALAKNAGR
ncbi:MAG: General stress protein 18 [Myxococcota bacterium]|nr:General stress protein 18 [Myxococcota bacterium]